MVSSPGRKADKTTTRDWVDQWIKKTSHPKALFIAFILIEMAIAVAFVTLGENLIWIEFLHGTLIIILALLSSACTWHFAYLVTHAKKRNARSPKANPRFQNLLGLYLIFYALLYLTILIAKGSEVIWPQGNHLLFFLKMASTAAFLVLLLFNLRWIWNLRTAPMNLGATVCGVIFIAGMLLTPWSSRTKWVSILSQLDRAENNQAELEKFVSTRDLLGDLGQSFKMVNPGAR